MKISNIQLKLYSFLPKWNPSTLAGMTDELLDAIFAPLPLDQEWTPLP